MDNFYEKVYPYRSGNIKLEIGQIAWVPTPFVGANVTIFEMERATRRDHENVNFRLQRLNSSHFKTKDDKLPIQNIKLRSTEELIAVKTKKRPCIFLGKADFPSREEGDKTLTRGRKHLLSKDYAFLPIYSTHKEESKGYPSQLVQRIRYFQYGHLTYLPECKLKGLETDYPPKEGIVRMDRIFITHPIVPNVTPTDIKIDETYMKLLLSHLREYLFREIDEDLRDMHDLLTDEFQRIEQISFS